MTRDTIIKLAREADAAHDNVQVTPFLERFAALIAQQEREACAAICDSYDSRYDLPELRWCADDIRARGEQ